MEQSVFIGDDFISIVQSDKLIEKCTALEINRQDTNALIKIIDSGNPYKNYISVLTHHGENEIIAGLANTIFAKIVRQENI